MPTKFSICVFVSIIIMASVTPPNYSLPKAVKTMGLIQLTSRQWHHNCFPQCQIDGQTAVPLTVAHWFKWWWYWLSIVCKAFAEAASICSESAAQMKWCHLHSQTAFVCKPSLLISECMQAFACVWFKGNNHSLNRICMLRMHVPQKPSGIDQMGLWSFTGTAPGLIKQTISKHYSCTFCPLIPCNCGTWNVPTFVHPQSRNHPMKNMLTKKVMAKHY